MKNRLCAVTFCPQVSAGIKTAVLFYILVYLPAKNVWKKQKDLLGCKLGNFTLVKVISILPVTG